MKSVERRKFERLPLRLAFHFNREDPPAVLTGITENISCEGLFFVSSQQIKRGETLEITLPLPDHKSVPPNPRVSLKCRAVVMRVHPERDSDFGVACKIVKVNIDFTDPDEKLSEAVEYQGLGLFPELFTRA